MSELSSLSTRIQELVIKRCLSFVDLDRVSAIPAPVRVESVIRSERCLTADIQQILPQMTDFAKEIIALLTTYDAFDCWTRSDVESLVLLDFGPCILRVDDVSQRGRAAVVELNTVRVLADEWEASFKDHDACCRNHEKPKDYFSEVAVMLGGVAGLLYYFHRAF